LTVWAEKDFVGDSASYEGYDDLTMIYNLDGTRAFMNDRVVSFAFSKTPPAPAA
jgi:hypothetical protein